jgi:hypothetical protein
MFGIFGVFLAGLDAFASWWQVLPPLVGGLTADLVCATRGASGSTTVARAAGALVPLTMISSSMLTFELAWGVEWPPELWLGAICLSALAGWGLAVLSHPPELPGARSGGPPALDPGRGAHGWR